MNTEKHFTYSLEFYAKLSHQRVVSGSVENFKVLSSQPYATSELEEFDGSYWVDGDDNMPEEEGYYHIYVVGHGEFPDFEEIGSGVEISIIDVEVDTVSYWKY